MHTQDLLQHILEQLFLRTHTDPQNVHENKTTVKMSAYTVLITVWTRTHSQPKTLTNQYRLSQKQK